MHTYAQNQFQASSASLAEKKDIQLETSFNPSSYYLDNTRVQNITGSNTPQNQSYTRVLPQYSNGITSQIRNIASTTNISSPFMNLNKNYTGFSSQSSINVRKDYHQIQQPVQSIQRTVEPIRIQSNNFNKLVSTSQPLHVQQTLQYTSHYENPANSRMSQASQNSWNAPEPAPPAPVTQPYRGQLQRAVSSGNLLPDNIPAALQRQNSFGSVVDLKRQNSFYMENLANEVKPQDSMNVDKNLNVGSPKVYFREGFESHHDSRQGIKIRSASNPVLRPQVSVVVPDKPWQGANFTRPSNQYENTIQNHGPRNVQTSQQALAPKNILMSNLSTQSHKVLPHHPGLNVSPVNQNNFGGYFYNWQQPQTPLMQPLGFTR